MSKNQRPLAFDPVVHMEAVARLLTRVTRQVGRRVSTRLIAAAEDQRLTVTQATILVEIFRGPGRTDKDLAEALGHGSPQLSLALKALLEKRLVSARANPRDGRQRLLHVAPEGEALASELNEAAIEDYYEVYTSLPPREQAVLESTVGASLMPQQESVVVALRATKFGDWGSVLAGATRVGCAELGWDESYVAQAAGAIAAIIQHPSKERHELAWVAQQGKLIVGACVLGLRRDPAAFEPDVMHCTVPMLYVLREHRRRGLGEKLLRLAIASAEEMMLYSVSLEIEDGQKDLIRLAKRLGFKAVGQVEVGFRYGQEQRWRDYSLKLTDMRKALTVSRDRASKPSKRAAKDVKRA